MKRSQTVYILEWMEYQTVQYYNQRRKSGSKYYTGVPNLFKSNLTATSKYLKLHGFQGIHIFILSNYVSTKES